MEGKPQHESRHVRQGLPEGRVPDASVTMEGRQEVHPNTALSGVHRGQAGLLLRARGGKESPNVQTTRHVLIRGARRRTPSHPGGSRTSNGGLRVQHGVRPWLPPSRCCSPTCTALMRNSGTQDPGLFSLLQLED